MHKRKYKNEEIKVFGNQIFYLKDKERGQLNSLPEMHQIVQFDSRKFYVVQIDRRLNYPDCVTLIEKNFYEKQTKVSDNDNPGYKGHEVDTKAI